MTGNAYAADGLPRVPASLDEALALWESSQLAADAFGADVVSHYATMARVELDAYRAGGDRLGAAPVLRANLTYLRWGWWREG